MWDLEGSKLLLICLAILSAGTCVLFLVREVARSETSKASSKKSGKSRHHGRRRSR